MYNNIGKLVLDWNKNNGTKTMFFVESINIIRDGGVSFGINLY